MKKLLFALILLGALLPLQVFALAEPDTIELTAVNKYTDVAQSGDALFWVDYTLLYTVQPDENISEGWLGRLIDVGGAGQISSVVPTASGGIPDGGYSQGVFCFYFDIEPVPTGTLTVFLTGNPALSPSPAGINTTSITDKAATDLPSDVRARAQILESVWGVDLLEATTTGPLRFTTTGEAYFEGACPGMRQIAPDLFTFTTVAQDKFEHTTDDTFSNAREAIWNGTTIGTAITSMQTGLGVNDATARLIAAMVVVIPLTLAIGGIAAGVTGGYSGSIFVVQLALGWVILTVLAWLGLVTFVIWGLITLGIAIVVGFGVFIARG